MKLPQSRKALDLAEQAFARLVASEEAMFRDEFVPCIAMIQRVGPIIDHETKGHRTHDFGTWWNATAHHPLFEFVRQARNAEFKRAEDVKRAEHNILIEDTITLSSSLTIEHIRGGKVIGRSSSVDSATPAVTTTKDPIHTLTWHFIGGNYDGHDVLDLLRTYLDWMRDDIIPGAERLTI